MLFASLKHATPIYHHQDQDFDNDGKTCTAMHFDRMRRLSNLTRRAA